MAKSFNNAIVSREVSLAVERVLLAPSTQVWTPARVELDVTSIPTGFRDLGAVVEDQVNLTIARDIYRLETGIPRTLKYSAVVGVSGRLEVMFHSISPRDMAYALGNVDPAVTVSTIYTTHAATAHSRTKLVLNTAGHGLAVGDVIVTATTSAGLLTTDNEAQVSSVGTGVDTLVVYLTEDGFPDVPSTSWCVAKVTQIAQPYGTSKIKEYHILGVADFIDGWQIVHDIQKARVAPGDMQEAYKPTESGRIMARWELFGYNSTRYDGGATHLVVAERFWFHK